MEEAILKYILGKVAAYAFARLVAAIPIFAVPPLSWIAGWIINIVATKFLHYFSIFLNFTIIDFETEIEQANYVKAKDGLLDAIASKDPEKIKQAEKDFDNALGPLIKFDSIPHTFG